MPEFANNYQLPVNKLSERMPSVMSDIRSELLPVQRVVDEGIAASLMTGNPSFVYEGVLTQDPTQGQQIRKLVSPDPLAQIIEESFEGELTTDEATGAIQNELLKQADWVSVGDRFYLEHAVSLNDPTIRNEAVRFAVNLQIGQELFEAAIEAESDGKSWFGYTTDFIDRYFLRTFPIGALENLTRRSERKGEDLLNAAVSMPPKEYEAFVKTYIEELKREGIFTGDNIFALGEGAAEFTNAGYDPWASTNQILAPLDLAPALIGVQGIKSLARASTPLRRLAALKGPEAAAEAGERILKANPDAPNPRVLNDMLPDAQEVSTPAPVKVPVNRTTKLMEDNKIVGEINYLNKRSMLGRNFDSPEVQAGIQSILTVLRKFTSNPIVNIDNSVRRGATGDFTLEVQLGTRSKGAPYRTEKAAQKAAAKLREADFPTSEVIPVDPSDASKGFYVQVTERVVTNNKGIDALPMVAQMGPLRTMIAKIAASRAATENPLLNVLAALAEDAATRIGSTIKPQLRTLRKLNNESKDTLSKIFTDLRDGPDSMLREAYNEAEFARKWDGYTGRAPTQLEIDAYHALRDINDTSWLLRSHARVKQYAERGYYAMQFPDGTRAPARLKQPPSGDTPILDMSTNRITSLNEARRDMKVWELDAELEGGLRYVIKPSKISVISPEDVLGYNAGGRRINPNASYFVTAGDISPKAFLTAFTEAQATKAVTQIRAIQEAIINRGTKLGKKSSKELDDFILENNDWNENIQSLDDFTEFMADHNVDISRPINYKVRDGAIQTGETLDEFSQNWGEYFTFQRKRSDDLITEYGGKEAIQRDPVAAMFDDFTSVTHQYARNVYTETALNAWLKAARKEGSGWDVPPTENARKAFAEAVQTEAKNSKGSELARQSAIIKNRMNMPTEIGKSMEGFGQAAREYVFDATKGKVRLPDGVVDKSTEGLLKVGFQSAFGFFNASQFLVQSFHSVTIAAMAPKFGMQGIGIAPILQMLLHSTDAGVSNLAKGRLARFAGMKAEDVDELVEYVSVSGRNIVESTAIQMGTSSSWGVSGWKGQSLLPSRLRDVKDTAKAAGSGVLDAGLVFFKEGERMSRLTGISTAFLEFKAKYPGMNAMSPFGRQWISRREQALTFRMTNVNRATMQEGVGRIPFQWFTYSMRVMENIFIGRDLSVGERARLAMVTMPFFGLTGMGLESATDYIAEKVGAEPAGSMTTLIQYGVLDALLDWTTGEQLGVANRLAPMTLFFDMWRNIDGESTPLEMLTGPSGNIAGGVLGAMWSATSNIWAGHPVSVTEDTIRVMRQFSGVDNVMKAKGIYQNGVYRSRNGRSLPFELDSSDAVAQLLGLTPVEVNEWYLRQRWSYKENQDIRQFSNRMTEEWREAVRMWDNGDPDRGVALMKEIEIKIALSGFAPSDQANIRKNLMELLQDDVYRMSTEYLKRNRPFGAQTVEEQFKPIGTKNAGN